MKIKSGSWKWILNRIICDLVLIIKIIIKNIKKTHENCSFYVRAQWRRFFFLFPHRVRALTSTHSQSFSHPTAHPPPPPPPCFYYRHFIHLKQAGQVLSRAFVIWIKKKKKARAQRAVKNFFNLHTTAATATTTPTVLIYILSPAI